VSEHRLVVGVGDCRVSDNPADELITYALGSCIGLAIHDPVRRVGGLLHFMLPDSGLDTAAAAANPFRFADSGIPALLDAVCGRGAEKHLLRVVAAGAAEIAGDASVFKIGRRNRAALRRIAWREGILVGAETVGGTSPRTLRLEVGTGRIFVRAAGEPERELLPFSRPHINRSDVCRCT
jgi:chemotaxis protein CheD